MARCDSLSQNRRPTGAVAAHFLSHYVRTGLLAAIICVLLFAPSTRAQDMPLPGDIGIGLVGIADWSTQQPFLDVMKTARPWIGHFPGQWGGMNEQELQDAGILDADGWPKTIPHSLRGIGTVLLTDLPVEAVSLAGRYRVSFDGNGIVEISGRATRVRYGDGQIEFDFEPGEGPVVLTINRTDRAKKGDYIRNIQIVHLDKLSHIEAGEIFNPDWVQHIGRFGLFRFMDWMETNDSTQSEWAKRPKMNDYTYARAGVPLEIMVRLANETQSDAWFNMPHAATDDYIAAFADHVLNSLNPALTAYVEYSNEVWNWQFEQASWVEDRARERWNKEYVWMQYYGLRTAEIMSIWKTTFAEHPDRLTTILSTQTGWQGLEQDALNAPLWQQDSPSNPRPGDVVDAYAVAGYFGRILGTPERAPIVRNWISESFAREQSNEAAKFDHAIALAAQELRDGSVTGDSTDSLYDLATNTLPYQADIAKQYDLDLIMYEGGTHVTGIAEILDDDALTEFFVALNYAPEMGVLYQDLLEIWAASGGQVFNAYADVAMPGMWGSWGNLRHLDDSNPRWDTLTGATKDGL